MSNRKMWTSVVALLMALSVAAVAAAQDATPQPAEIVAPEEFLDTIGIFVPEDGVGYDAEGNLLVVAFLTNVGSQVSRPLDLVLVVLNDCIVQNVPQTCRYLAFGVFEDVAPNGIAPGETAQWTFNFGPFPQVQLGNWSILWYRQ